MKLAIAAAAALMLATTAAFADGLSQDDFAYLQKTLGLTAQSAVLKELTPNEQGALHSAINDLHLYPESRDRQVKRYLALVYARECKRWVVGHDGQNCSPATDPAIQPGKEISDKICATCHLFGSDGRSFHDMASDKEWNAHKVEHALRHTPAMVPLRLTPEMLDQLAAYINSFKGN
ncbi:MAG TPA: cytochrome c [Stellaceae bacterium]|nr:cytochrome c [Stellaceae bacterium]